MPNVYPRQRKKRDSFSLTTENLDTDPLVEEEEDEILPLTAGGNGAVDSEFDLESYLPRLGRRAASEAEPANGELEKRKERFEDTGDVFREQQRPEPEEDFFADAKKDFNSLEEYDQHKAAQKPPEQKPLREATRIYSWRDEAGKLHATDKPEEVPPTVAAQEFVGRGPAQPEPVQEPVKEYPPMMATEDYAEGYSPLVQGLLEAAPEMENKIAPERRQRVQTIAQANVAKLPKSIQSMLPNEPLDVTSELLGNPVPAAKGDLESVLSQLPRESFLETMGEAWERRESKEPGFLSKATAFVDMFGDVVSLGGTAQLELDYARRLVLEDPEAKAMSEAQGVNLRELVFPDWKEYDLAYGWLTNKYRGGMPFTRRTRYGAIQNHWREKAKEHPELVDLIARKTAGAIESGLAMEHFNELGFLEAIKEGLITDPMFMGTLIVGGVTGALKATAGGLSAAGKVGTAAKVARAAEATQKARVAFEPLETVVGKAIGAGVRGGTKIAKPATRKVAGAVLPEAELGIRRALFKKWENSIDRARPGGRKRWRFLARMATMFDDADLVTAHSDRFYKAVTDGLQEAGMSADDVARHGATIEKAVTDAQKLKRHIPYLYTKSEREANKALGKLGGKTLTKNGELTPIGKVVNYLDTGQGLDTLDDAERKVAEGLRTILDDLKAKLPEDVGKVEDYFPRFEPEARGTRPVQRHKRVLGKEPEKFWEESRKADVPAVKLYETREQAIEALARRMAAQPVREIHDQIDDALIKLTNQFDLKKTKKELAGYKVAKGKGVQVGEGEVSLDKAKQIVSKQKSYGTKAGDDAAARIEARIAEAEKASSTEIVSAQKKKAAGKVVERVKPEVKKLKHELGSASKEIKGLEKQVRPAEKLKANLEALQQEGKELRRGISQMEEGAEKTKRLEAYELQVERIKIKEAELAKLQPTEKDIKSYATQLYKQAKEREKEQGMIGRTYKAVREEFGGDGIKIKKPTKKGAELDAWKRLPSTWKGTEETGQEIDVLINRILENDPIIKSKFGDFPDPSDFIEDMKMGRRGESSMRVDDFKKRASEEWNYYIEPEETKILDRLEELKAERDSILDDVIRRQSDDAIEEAEKAKWVEASRKRIEALDREFANMQAALPPDQELEQLAVRLDLAYKDRDKLAKALADKRVKLREYNAILEAKPVYKDVDVDVGEFMRDYVRKYPVVASELEEMERWHSRFIMRPFRTSVLGYRPSYALRNIATFVGRTTNEMLNGILEGKPWAMAQSDAWADMIHVSDEFWYQSMGARHMPTTSKGVMGKIPHFVYSTEAGADRFFKTGATIGKVRAEVTRLAHLNEVKTAGRMPQEIVDDLTQKGVITDFTGLVRKHGIEEANRIFFNFQDRIGLMLGVPGQMFPFAEFGYKNFKYVTKDMVKHPWKLRGWKIAFDQWAYQYRNHPEYARHVVKLTDEGPLKYFNHLFMQPLYSIGGFQALRPFLEGTSEYDQKRIEMFEPVMDRLLALAEREKWSKDELERQIDKESATIGAKGGGSLRAYLDNFYMLGPQTGYKHNKEALREIVDVTSQNLSLGPTAQWMVAQAGLAKYDAGRQWLGWQNVIQEVGLIAAGKEWQDVIVSKPGEASYERKIKQEMTRQQLRGESQNRRQAEKDVGKRLAMVHAANNLLPLSLRSFTPEDEEMVATIEARQRALRGQVAVSETPPSSVYKHQLETGDSYEASKFKVEAGQAQKKNEYGRVKEVRAGGMTALVPAWLSTKSEEVESKRVDAALHVVATVPDSDRAATSEAYGIDGMVLADISKPSRNRLDGDYYDKLNNYIMASGTERNKMVAGDADIQMFELSGDGVGSDRQNSFAKEFIDRLAADAIATGDRESFEKGLMKYPDVVDFVQRMEGGVEFLTKTRADVMKGVRKLPESINGHVNKINRLRAAGKNDELVKYTDNLSNETVNAIKDEVGAGNYKNWLDDAKEIQNKNEAEELLKGVLGADEPYRAWNNLNKKDQGKIEEFYPEMDMPERVENHKKRMEEKKEDEYWKQRVVESNYDVRMRKIVPADVRRRLADKNQSWRDFFLPHERTEAEKEAQAQAKKARAATEKRREFLKEAEKWKRQIVTSEFSTAFKGSRVPMEVKRFLADKDPAFEDFFFGKASAKKRSGSRRVGGSRSSRQQSPQARFAVNIEQPGSIRRRRKRSQMTVTAQGQRGSSTFRRATEKAGRPG